MRTEQTGLARGIISPLGGDGSGDPDGNQECGEREPWPTQLCHGPTAETAEIAETLDSSEKVERHVPRDSAGRWTTQSAVESSNADSQEYDENSWPRCGLQARSVEGKQSGGRDPVPEAAAWYGPRDSVCKSGSQAARFPARSEGKLSNRDGARPCSRCPGAADSCRPGVRVL